MCLAFLQLDLDDLTHTQKIRTRIFNASAVAGLNVVRNMTGAGSPLFTKQLPLKEGF